MIYASKYQIYRKNDIYLSPFNNTKKAFPDVTNIHASEYS